jgi:rSAM/selenodomain-associated transferase 1
MNDRSANKYSRALIVVAKRPAAGRTKTRLTPPLSAGRAAALYECFLLDTIELVRTVQEVKPVLAYLPEGEEPYFQHLAPDFELILQEGHDLGSRLDYVTRTYLEMGYREVVIMNSDSPTLPGSYLQQAFDTLQDGADLVLGPCDDGGYYLIGMKRPVPRLLREVPMSTPTVTSDTLTLAEACGLRVSLLPYWFDVDDVDTLERLRRALREVAEGDLAHHTWCFLRNTLPQG